MNLNTADFGASQGWIGIDFCGPGIKLSASVRAEIGYLNQYTFRSNGPDRVDHTLCMNVFWNFDPR